MNTYASAHCRSIATMPTKDRARLAQLMRGLIHEEPDETYEAVLGINVLLARSGLRLEDLALYIYDETKENDMRMAA